MKTNFEWAEQAGFREARRLLRKPLLSILITYHDECELLTDCLSSLLGGGSAPDEIIVYDDASVSPAEKYIPVDARAKVIRGERAVGPAKARNILLKQARFDYVHFHDSDDLFDQHWLSEIRNNLQSLDKDIIFTNVRSVKDGRTICEKELQFPLEREADALITMAIRGSLLVPSGTFKRNAALEIGGFRESLWQAEDYDFYIRLAAQGLRWEVVDRSLVTIRVRKNSRSQNVYEVYNSALQSVELLSREISEKYAIELSETASRFSGVLFNAGHQDLAERGYALARRLGRPKYVGRSRAFKFVARALSPIWAERIGKVRRVWLK